MAQATGPKGLHHIGIAVRSLDEALPHWTQVLGLELQSRDEVPSEGVRVAVLKVGDTRIELLEPLSADSPVGKFLDKRGPGVHHLAFHVDDCQRKIDGMKTAGAQMLHDAPRKGAHDCRVAFAHPKSMDGVLCELVEDPHHG